MADAYDILVIGGAGMIGSLRGTVLERTATGEAIVEVGGVGYRVLVPARALTAIIPGEPSFLFTHLHVREDAVVLAVPSREHQLERGRIRAQHERRIF